MKKRHVLLSLTILLVGYAGPVAGQLADSPWPMSAADAQRTAHASVNGPATDPQILWSTPLAAPGDPRYVGEFYSPVVGPEGTVYTAYLTEPFSQGGVLTAIGPDGQWQWSYDFLDGSDPMRTWGAPSVDAQGNIYVVAQNRDGAPFQRHLVSLSSDGALRWNYEYENAGDNFVNPAIGPDGTIFISSGYIYGVHAVNTNGTQRWFAALPSSPLDVTEVTLGDSGQAYVMSGYNSAAGVTYGAVVQQSNGAVLQTWMPCEDGAGIGPHGQNYRVDAAGHVHAQGGIYDEDLNFITMADTFTRDTQYVDYRFGLTILSDGSTVFGGGGTLGAFDDEGTLLWELTLASDIFLNGDLLISDDTDHIYVPGYEEAAGWFDTRDYFIFAFDGGGNELWRLGVDAEVTGLIVGGEGRLYALFDDQLHAVIPEPATVGLFVMGLSALLARRGRRRMKGHK